MMMLRYGYKVDLDDPRAKQRAYQRMFKLSIQLKPRQQADRCQLGRETHNEGHHSESKIQAFISKAWPVD